MIVNILKETKSRQYVALLISLFIAVNSVQGTVLCFGADGHIEFESAFHEQCTDHVHSRLVHSNHSSENEHDEDIHCHKGQCVDIPVDFDLIRISQTTEKLNRALVAIEMDAIVAILPSDCSEYDPVADECRNPSYFNPLRTIILLA